MRYIKNAPQGKILCDDLGFSRDNMLKTWKLNFGKNQWFLVWLMAWSDLERLFDRNQTTELVWLTNPNLRNRFTGQTEPCTKPNQTEPNQ